MLDTQIFLLNFTQLMFRSHLDINYTGCYSGDLGNTVLAVSYSITFYFLMLLYFVQRLREEMEEITQQQLVHDKYCKDLMGFSTKPRHITPFTSFQSLQPSQSNALAGLLGYSAHQGIMGFATSPVPAKSTLVESRCCRDLMEEKFDQVCVCWETI